MFITKSDIFYCFPICNMNRKLFFMFVRNTRILIFYVIDLVILQTENNRKYNPIFLNTLNKNDCLENTFTYLSICLFENLADQYHSSGIYTLNVFHEI